LAGRQDPIAGVPLIYGCSITDGCIDWENSVAVLQRLGRAVEIRRSRRRS
jgi:3-deoxy-7-phosphoheptulonate synthase